MRLAAMAMVLAAAVSMAAAQEGAQTRATHKVIKKTARQPAVVRSSRTWAITKATPRYEPMDLNGRWWNNRGTALWLSLTQDQIKRMDDAFQQHRLKLIDANASVQKEEAILEPLVAAEQPDEGRIVAQIDRVAQARAELEKTNARMLLGIRKVLTVEQWAKLKEVSPQR